MNAQLIQGQNEPPIFLLSHEVKICYFYDRTGHRLWKRVERHWIECLALIVATAQKHPIVGIVVKQFQQLQFRLNAIDELLLLANGELHPDLLTYIHGLAPEGQIV